MPGYFFDTSALVKLYHFEAGTSTVDQIASAPQNVIRISRLTAVELRSAFAIKVRTNVIDRQDADQVLRQFREEVAGGKFEIFSVGESEFAMADKLIERYAFDRHLRALDALQLSIALELRDQDLIDFFVSADRILGEVAGMEGLKVIDPERSSS